MIGEEHAWDRLVQTPELVMLFLRDPAPPFTVSYNAVFSQLPVIFIFFPSLVHPCKLKSGWRGEEEEEGILCDM